MGPQLHAEELAELAVEVGDVRLRLLQRRHHDVAQALEVARREPPGDALAEAGPLRERRGFLDRVDRHRQPDEVCEDRVDLRAQLADIRLQRRSGPLAVLELVPGPEQPGREVLQRVAEAGTRTAVVDQRGEVALEVRPAGLLGLPCMSSPNSSPPSRSSGSAAPFSVSSCLASAGTAPLYLRALPHMPLSSLRLALLHAKRNRTVPPDPRSSTPLLPLSPRPSRHAVCGSIIDHRSLAFSRARWR